MANTLPNPTQGFQVFSRMEGASPTAGLQQVWIASTDASLIFRGDPVITSSIGGTNNSGAYITAAASGNTTTIRGVFMGLEQFQPSANRVVWFNAYLGSVSGSTGDVRAYICDDPDVLFQVFGSTAAAITSSFIGRNIGFTANSTSGNQTLGFSNVTLQSTTFGATATFPFRIVDFYSNYAPPGVPNVGTAAFINGTDNTTPANIVVVRMNNCDRLNTTAPSS